MCLCLSVNVPLRRSSAGESENMNLIWQAGQTRVRGAGWGIRPEVFFRKKGGNVDEESKDDKAETKSELQSIAEGMRVTKKKLKDLYELLYALLECIEKEADK